MMSKKLPVLSHINAPYSEKLNEAAVAHCLLNPTAAEDYPGHMSSFFGEIPLDWQIEFAESQGVSKAALVDAAKIFSGYSGQQYVLTT